MKIKKSMKLGNKFIYLISFICFFISTFILKAEQKIISTTLINIDKIKPSYEEPDESNNDQVQGNRNIREKEKQKNKTKSSHAILIGLDKITAKSSKIIVNLDESKKFGPLEIKILKCGKVRVNNRVNDVAYMQVKDMTKKAQSCIERERIENLEKEFFKTIEIMAQWVTVRFSIPKANI